MPGWVEGYFGPATAACAATAARLSGWNCWILDWRNGCCLGLGMLFVLLLSVVVCCCLLFVVVIDLLLLSSSSSSSLLLLLLRMLAMCDSIFDSKNCVETVLKLC